MDVPGPARFQVFGPQHWVILGIFAVGCVLVVLAGRRLPEPRRTRVRRVAAVLVVLSCLPFEAEDWLHAHADWRTGLPVQICDVAWLVAAVALWRGGGRWAGLAYFWCLTLTLQGVLTPDLDHVFPQAQFFGFWLRHLLPVWAGLFLVGAGVGPRWRDYRFAMATTALWAATMMTINAALGSNYGYLNGKPASHSLLDLIGPWPWYVGVEVLLVASVWALMTWPWNRAHGGPGSAHGAGRVVCTSG